MLTIWAGVMPVHPVTSPLFYLDTHFPREKLDSALIWLIKNGLVGERFVALIHEQCAGSNLELLRYLLQKVEKTADLRPLVAHKDVRL